MRMSKVFPLPIEIDNYKGVALSPERNKAIEHAVNHHDKLVETLRRVNAQLASYVDPDGVAVPTAAALTLLESGLVIGEEDGVEGVPAPTEPDPFRSSVESFVNLARSMRAASSDDSLLDAAEALLAEINAND